MASPEATPALVSLYSPRQWRIAGVMFVSYVAVSEIAAILVPPEAWLFPASAILLASLYFGGRRLWPIAAIAAVVANVFTGTALVPLIIFTLAATGEAYLGAYLLEWTQVDPLFRHYRDMFYFIATAAIVSFITPTFGLLAALLIRSPLGIWGYHYVSTFLTYLVMTPFILRWFAKRRFGRTTGEIFEIVALFAVLIGLDTLIFIGNIRDIEGIPLIYFILAPLFWIALRMRPRFITLALLITAIFAVGSALISAPPELVPARLYLIEISLIMLSISFFIIVSLEEERRVSTNVMRSQLATLENAVTRVITESTAKNDFIAVLAHELRNPLAPVLSSIELMKLKAGRDAEDQEALDLMEDRMNTIKRLLDDLLDISRITEGKVNLSREIVDLRGVVRRALVTTEHLRKERHQSLAFADSYPRIPVIGDPIRLEQVFSNLLANASKYSDPGDTITLSMRISGEWAQVEVTDQGIGISPEGFETIFAPFQQLGDAAQRKKGLGIGLALVKSFTEMHGGSVRAASPGAGKGSRFTVELPLAPAQALSPEYVEAKVPSDPLRRTILIVDDNDAAAAGLGKLLELQGHAIQYAYTAAGAIELALSGNPDIALVDIGLPDQDGYAVAKILRARGFTGRLVALTGYSTDEAKAEGKLAGFEAYLVKPVGITELKRIIAELS